MRILNLNHQNSRSHPSQGGDMGGTEGSASYCISSGLRTLVRTLPTKAPVIKEAQGEK